MFKVLHFNVFYTKQEKDVLKVVFDEKLSLTRGGEVFFLTSYRSQSLKINVDSLEIEDMYKVFLFQSAQKTLRLTLHQLLSRSDFSAHLRSLIYQKNSEADQRYTEEKETNLNELVAQLVAQNKRHLVNLALDKRDESLFYELTNGVDLL